jgi:RNA polymerase sigma factor (sigma-70 family)
MNKYTEQELIEGIKKGDGLIIRFLMKHHAESIKKMVNELKIGRQIQSEDIIQEGMVELMLNIRENKFRGGSSVTTYYYSICRFIALKQYNKFKNIYPVSDDVEIRNEDFQDFEIDERIGWVLEILKGMKKECIEIIDLRFGLSAGSLPTDSVSNRGFEEIAKILKIEYANARQRFSRCLQALLSEYQRRKGHI